MSEHDDYIKDYGALPIGMDPTEWNPALVEELLTSDKLPPEREFKNVEDLLEWLNNG